MPQLGVHATGLLPVAALAGPHGREADTSGSSPTDAFGRLRKVGHCVLFRFQEAAERQGPGAGEASSSSSSFCCLRPRRRANPAPFQRRCFKGLPLTLTASP